MCLALRWVHFVKIFKICELILVLQGLDIFAPSWSILLKCLGERKALNDCLCHPVLSDKSR